MNDAAIAIAAQEAKRAVDQLVKTYDAMNKVGGFYPSVACTSAASYAVITYDSSYIRQVTSATSLTPDLITVSSNSSKVRVFHYEVTLKNRIATAMNALVHGDNWMALDDQSLFKAAILGARLSEPPITDKEWEAVLWELKTMQALSIAAQGIPVDFQTLATMAPASYEPLGLARLWHNAHEEKRRRKAEADMREVAPTLDAMAKGTQEKIRI